MKLAPIALFTYNRLSHTMRTIEALQKNTLANESDLFIFSDGWTNEKDKEKVLSVRHFFKQITGFKSIQIYESETNQKLAPSLITGVSKLLEKHDKIIVFEDDLICSELTLDFLNDSLEIYKNDTKVGMIHGHIEDIKGLPELFFQTTGGCLGWGTWKRAWKEVNFNGEELLSQIQEKKLERAFDLNGGYKYIKMLKNQIAGINSSWAIRVYASFFLKDILILYPGKSYVQHIGFDTGTHCYSAKKGSKVDGNITATHNVAKRIPIEVNRKAMKQIEKFYKKRKFNLRFISNAIQIKLRNLLAR